MALEWHDPEDAETESVAPMSVPCIVKVTGETGGKWLLTGDLIFAWLPSSEGLGRNLRGLPQEEWSQERFDEFTDTSKWTYFVKARGGKPT